MKKIFGTQMAMALVFVSACALDEGGDLDEGELDEGELDEGEVEAHADMPPAVGNVDEPGDAIALERGATPDMGDRIGEAEVEGELDVAATAATYTYAWHGIRDSYVVNSGGRVIKARIAMQVQYINGVSRWIRPYFDVTCWVNKRRHPCSVWSNLNLMSDGDFIASSGVLRQLNTGSDGFWGVFGKWTQVWHCSYHYAYTTPVLIAGMKGVYYHHDQDYSSSYIPSCP